MVKKLCGIYSYRDLRDGHKIVYIGQSRDIYHRHRAHARDKKSNQPIDLKILEDNKRYIVRIEKYCEPNELNDLEKEYIKKYQPKYNCTKGGDYVHHKHGKGGKSEYTLWDSSKVHYVSHKNQNRSKPFRWYYHGWYVKIGYQSEWYTIYILNDIAEEEAQKDIQRKIQERGNNV